MKKEINYLPENKQQELSELVQVVCKYHPQVDMIILFGSYARGNWVEEKYEGTSYFRYQSDFDILVVIDNRSDSTQTKIERALESAIDEHEAINTPITVLVHDIEFVNRRLRKAQYFFLDIKREGVLLYDSGRCQLKEARELSSRERQHLAQEDFDYWFESAIDFHEGFEFYLEKRKLD